MVVRHAANQSVAQAAAAGEGLDAPAGGGDGGVNEPFVAATGDDSMAAEDTEPPPAATEPPPAAAEPPPAATEPPSAATEPPPAATEPPAAVAMGMPIGVPVPAMAGDGGVDGGRGGQHDGQHNANPLWLAGVTVLVVPILLAFSFSTAAMLAAPAAKYLVISSNVTVAVRFQREMKSMLNVPVDVMCANTSFCRTRLFNCESETSAISQIMACVPRWSTDSRLRAYEAVYLVESGSPHRLNRSPFHDNAVYEHVRGQLGRDRGTHVTVVFTDVTCNGMGRHMRTSSKQEEDCLASPAGRRESFQRFSARVGVLQGNLEGDYFYVDAEEGLSVTGQVTLALLIASDRH